MDKKNRDINRRQFIRTLGVGAMASMAVWYGCTPDKRGKITPEGIYTGEVPTDKMTYRTNTSTGDKVSLLGYGCMRWPATNGEKNGPLDQEMINELIDYALAHGVNYFDTAPTYCGGKSEEATGIALSRHPRNSYYIATKLSNFNEAYWSREESLKMYHNSFKHLKVDYIDYLLLHGVGMGGMESLNKRYIDNGILDYLLAERKAGRIRNLGFSYHGDVEVFDYLLANNDKYHWDFVQIQLNYVDWRHAKEINSRNTNAEYLYNELEKHGIQAVIMEPLLGGRLASNTQPLMARLKERRPNASIASWAFRFAGTPQGILTVLSGMTYMEHLQDNIRTFSPHEPCNEEELAVLESVATDMLRYSSVPCTACAYCMPCPYGVDIPGVFTHYNKCINEGNVPLGSQDENYKQARRAFLIGYDRSVPRLQQASHCIGCGECLKECPQNIDIPAQMMRIDNFVEDLKQGREF